MTKLIKFQKNQLEHELNSLPDGHVRLFGLACVERMSPCLLEFARQSRPEFFKIFQSSLDLMWDNALEVRLDSQTLDDLEMDLEASEPDPEDPEYGDRWGLHETFSVLMSSIDLFRGDERRTAVLCANGVTELLDSIIMECLYDTPGGVVIFDPERTEGAGSRGHEATYNQERIDDHWMMQSELLLQRRDLQRLASTRDADPDAMGQTLKTIRKNAMHSAYDYIPLMERAYFSVYGAPSE